jgi:beta-lactamase superfamily II metal-dependent hydrolase
LGILILSVTAAIASAAVPAPTTAPVPPPLGRHEAEQAALSDGATIGADPTASCGEFVHFAKTGRLHWLVDIPESGRYELTIRYRTPTADRAQFLAVNGKEFGVGFPMSTNEWAEVRTVRSFGAGQNTVELRAGWGEMDIDLLRFTILPRGAIAPVVEMPMIAPHHNVAYRQAANELLFKVDLGGHELTAADMDDRHPLAFQAAPYPPQDDAVLVRIPASSLSSLPTGIHRLHLRFDGGVTAEAQVELRDRPDPADWTIITLNVSHGSSTFMRLPSGKTLLLDTGTAERAAAVVLPFLQAQGVKKLDYLILTHYHDDHAGGLALVEKSLAIGTKWDYKSFRVGRTIDVDGVQMKVLNAFESGNDENPRSLALRFEYKGFVYIHSGDIYGSSQQQELTTFKPEELRAHVILGNHHMHGSIDVSFYRAADPVLVLVSAEDAVYARGAYTTHYQEGVERYLRSRASRFRDTLLTRELGHIIVRVNDADHWTYETTPDLRTILIP